MCSAKSDGGGETIGLGVGGVELEDVGGDVPRNSEDWAGEVLWEP